MANVKLKIDNDKHARVVNEILFFNDFHSLSPMRNICFEMEHKIKFCSLQTYLEYYKCRFFNLNFFAEDILKMKPSCAFYKVSRKLENFEKPPAFILDQKEACLHAVHRLIIQSEIFQKCLLSTENYKLCYVSNYPQDQMSIYASLKKTSDDQLFTYYTDETKKNGNYYGRVLMALRNLKTKNQQCADNEEQMEI